MKKLLLFITAILVLFACKKKSTQGMLLIDTEHATVEGSFVQGSINSDLCKAVIPYSNSNGGTAEITAAEVNGMKIETQNVTLNSSSGEIKVNIIGGPLLLESTFLQVKIKYEGNTYVTSVEIPIASDPDPSGTVTFTIDNTPIIGLTSPITLNFSVDPKMTAVINTSTTPIQGLTVSISTNSTTGQGTVTLTPSATFVGGTLELTAQFGARPTQVVSIPVSYFASGDGTATDPFQITDDVSLAKIQYGTSTQYFKVMNAITANSWTPITSFNTNLDGNGQTITYTTNTPTVDSVALIKRINGGSITNFTLLGTATGKNVVAGLAAYSAIAITGITSTVNVTGANNVANIVASGTGKDANVLVVGTLLSTINIVAPASSASESLGITPIAGITYNEVSNTTGSTLTYATDGKITATMPTTAGDITYYMALTSATNVRTSNFTLTISSKPMYESGTGTSTDPYIVVDAEQLYQTMINNPTTYIKVKNNITVTSWTTITNFSGNLDGDGYTVSGLNNPMITTLTGTVKNIKLTNVNISSAATGNIGTVANTNTGNISAVAVVGTLTRTATGDQPFGGIAGQHNNGGVINNCYVNVTMSSTTGMVGGIVGSIQVNAVTEAIVEVSNCTSEGSITITGSQSKIGGIVGRRQGNFIKTAGNDIIKNCNSSMIITGSAAGMFGGIFGALQTSGGITVQQCLFTGRATSTYSSGGIMGVGGDVADCIVVGLGADASNSTVATTITNNTSVAAGIVSGAKGNVTRCIVSNARITGPALTSKIAGASGIVNTQNSNTPNVSNSVVINTSIPTGGSAVLGATAGMGSTLTPNYYSGVTYTDGSAYTLFGDDRDGIAAPATMDQSWYTTLGYDFTTVWDWDATNNRPKLRNVGCNSSVIP